MNFLIRILLSAVGVFIAAYVIPGVNVNDFWTAVIVAVIIGVLNWTVRPLLIIFTIPLTIFTLGLFLLVINALIILLADYLVGGFSVEGFWWALLFSVVLTILNSFFQDLSSKDKPY